MFPPSNIILPTLDYDRCQACKKCQAAASCRFSTIDMIVLLDGTFMPVYGCGRHSGGDSSTAIVCRLQCRAVPFNTPLQCDDYVPYEPPAYRGGGPEAVAC